MKPNKRLRAAFLEIVGNQIEAADPPETRATYERLRETGRSDSEARRLIACVVAAEMHRVLATREPFDRVRYARLLEDLPVLPWESEGSADPSLA